MAEISGIFAEFLEIPENEVVVTRQQGKASPDFLVNAYGYQFLVECKSSSARAPLFTALLQVSEFKDLFGKDAIPLIIVPYMGKTGMAFCRKHDLSWMDLSGNTHIKAPKLLIHVEGRPNRFKQVGRPANVFAPKSARIVRQLLIDPVKRYNQRELSRITGLDEGHTSRIVRRLEALNLIDRDDNGALRPSVPDELLMAWHETYVFSRHQIIKGHIAARSGEELLERMTQTLARQKIEYAATGLAGAWQYTHFAKFRVTTLYLADVPGKKLLGQLQFREDDRGTNTWLVVPDDDGVFRGSAARDGIICVHPVQIFLDLKEHPERAQEAALMVRKQRLNWTAG